MIKVNAQYTYTSGKGSFELTKGVSFRGKNLKTKWYNTTGHTSCWTYLKPFDAVVGPSCLSNWGK